MSLINEIANVIKQFYKISQRENKLKKIGGRKDGY